MAAKISSDGGIHIAGTKLGESDEHYHELTKHLVVPSDAQGSETFKTGDRSSIAAMEDAKQREIFDAMQASKCPFAFASLLDAQSNLVLRTRAIEAMTRLNTGAFDADYFDPTAKVVPRIGATFYDIQSKSRKYWWVGKYWAPDNIADGWSAAFNLEQDVAPSQALDPDSPYSLFPFRGECAGALQIAVYLGAISALGVGVFDQQQSAEAVEIGQWGRSVNLYMQLVPLDDTPVPGDYLYFRNDPDYLKYAPHGFWQGLNCLYVGKDWLGTERYSGLGAVWQSEVELRQSLKNAFYGDCYPHSVEDPKTQIIFTKRFRLVIDKTSPAGEVPTAPSAPAPETSQKRPTPEVLRAAGFEEIEPGIFLREPVTLKELSAALGFDPAHLVQSASAPASNPAHKVMLDGIACIVEYLDEAAPRRDPSTMVRAIVNTL